MKSIMNMWAKVQAALDNKKSKIVGYISIVVGVFEVAYNMHVVNFDLFTMVPPSVWATVLGGAGVIALKDAIRKSTEAAQKLKDDMENIKKQMEDSLSNSSSVTKP